MRIRAVVRPFLCALLSSLAAVHVGGCDSSESKGATSDGGGPEDPVARQIQGRVLLGTEPAANAIVDVVPSFGLSLEVRLPDAGDPNRAVDLTTTDLDGHYQLLNGAFLYDLSVRKDREVVVFRGLARRNFDPSLGRDAELRGFTSRISAATDPPPAPGNAIAFLVGGADARALSGDQGSLLATFRRFDTAITLRAIEYVASSGLAAAVRAGKVDVLVHDGGAATAVVPTALASAEHAIEVRFIAAAPAGFALSMVDVMMDFGLRTAARPVASVAAGTPLRIAVVADARYFARVRALHAGVVSDSGFQPFDPNPAKAVVVLTLPPPIADAKFERGNFSAMPVPSKGVVEHVLTPASAAGISLRLATAAGITALPDLTRLGLTRMTGRYSWSVQHFPALEHIEDLGGEDGRLFTPVSTTAPRPIDLP